jgi:histidine ammonia-lyase
MDTLVLAPGRLTLDALRRVWSTPLALSVDPSARDAVDASAATVARVLAHGDTVYGVNTGFGLLARTRIDDARLTELQRALVLSHSAGTGAWLDAATVRLVMALKVASLARGYSGVRGAVIDGLVTVANAGIVPCIPCQGSVGASGDLAPLAHLAAVLIGRARRSSTDASCPVRRRSRCAAIPPIALHRRKASRC